MEIFQEQDDDVEQMDFKINEIFADKYLRSKKSEDASNLKRKYLNFDPESSSSSEEEDEFGDLLTPELDLQIEKTLTLLKKKDPCIYSEEKSFFDQDIAIPEKVKPEKPFTIKDYHRRELLSGLGESNSQSLPIVEQEQLLSQQVKKAFADAVQDDDQDLLTVVEHSRQSDLKKSRKENIDVEDENEAFLRDYLNGKKWLDSDNIDHRKLELIEMSDEERGIDATESFEADFNFRFEEKGAESLISHSRTVDSSLRRKDDKRKRMREKKNSRKEEEKIKKEEELKRLKNLKKEEIMERLKKIEQVSGAKVGDLEEFLTRDFDPNDFDDHMGNTFGQDYYSTKDKKFPLDQEELSQDISEELSLERENIPLLNENLKKKKDSHLDDLYALDYEDLIGDLPVRFKYRSVNANNYGLDPKDILIAEDKDLNEFLSLKKLAPFRSAEKLKKDSKSWKKHGKTKLSEFKSNLKKRKKSDSSSQKDSDSRLASYNL